jgi:hypothetical protein
MTTPAALIADTIIITMITATTMATMIPCRRSTTSR